VSADNDHAATVQALIDRIEARAYESGEEARPRLTLPERDALTATATAGIPPAQPPEHPILRKLRLLCLRWSELSGLVTGMDDQAGDPLTREDLHAYRREYDAAHQNDAQRPQTGQGGHAAPERATGQTGR
jgi:hypothetical protein